MSVFSAENFRVLQKKYLDECVRKQESTMTCSISPFVSKPACKQESAQLSSLALFPNVPVGGEAVGALGKTCVHVWFQVH